jgi:hypothetical protein
MEISVIPEENKKGRVETCTHEGILRKFQQIQWGVFKPEFSIRKVPYFSGMGRS